MPPSLDYGLYQSHRTVLPEVDAAGEDQLEELGQQDHSHRVVGVGATTEPTGRHQHALGLGGQMVIWSEGHMVTWTNGHMITWSDGQMVIWSYG